MDSRLAVRWGAGLLTVLFWTPPVWAEYQAKGKRDPFVPLLTSNGQRIHPPGLDEETQSGAEDLVLQGIMFDPHSYSFALINGQLLTEQSQMGGVKVLKIQPGSVTVLVNGQERQLSVEKPKEEQATGK